MKAGIWGIGERTERYLRHGYFRDFDILFFIDTYKSRDVYHGKDVISPQILVERENEVDYIIVSSRYLGEILGIIWELGIDRRKVIFTEFVSEAFYLQDLPQLKMVLPKLYNDIRMRRVHLMFENETDDFDCNRIVGTGQYNSIEYKTDYFRYRSFEFVGDEIIRNGIQGAIAELGVFRGMFSSLISQKLPEKDIYLFDTFGGFDINEAEREKSMGRSNDEFIHEHTLTDLDTVMSNMPYKDRCHICKGLFPDTVTNEISELEFCFVSIDVDFEDSILEGLRFFYPRLSCGGYIFVHDYNSQMLTGVKNAVGRYERELGKHMAKVPLADRAGTLVITKQL